MHIAFGIERYWPASGGAEAYVRSVARQIGERHRVTVITLVRDDSPLTPVRRSLRLPNLPPASDGPIRIVPLRVSLHQRLRLAPILAQMLPHQGRELYSSMRSYAFQHFARTLVPQFIDALGDADVIHTVAPWEMSHMAQLAAKTSGIPHILTGLMHPGYWADDRHSIDLFRCCDVVIALLCAERAAYERAGVSPTRIQVVGVPAPIPSYFDRSLFESTFPSIRHPFVLFVGVKRPYKGYELMLEAAPHVWHRFPEVTFLFLGPRSKESVKFFSQVVDSRIVEVGKVPDELRDAALARCSVVCLPSATEILPNVVLEAWAARKPVIVSDIPTLAELVAGGGLTTARTSTAIAEAIIHLLDNPHLAARLGEEGHRKATEEFSASRIASALEDIYNAVTQRAAET
jgi:phosphatidyl-myo-inositol dimannoside synthase